MGDSQKSTNESTRDMLTALAAYAPDAIRAINTTAPDTARTQLAIDQELYPQYYALDRTNQLQGSQNELDIANGTGSKLTDAAVALQAKVDPEFYKSKAIIGDAINKYIGNYDPNNLSETELEGIRRGLGREGPVSDSALNTVKNAQVFNNAGTQRWQNFGNAIAQAGSVLPALKNGFSGFEVATRRALSPLPSNSTTAIGNNFGFANNTLNQIGANQRLAESKKKDTMDMIIGGTQAFANIGAGIGGIGRGVMGGA